MSVSVSPSEVFELAVGVVGVAAVGVERQLRAGGQGDLLPTFAVDR